MEIREILPKVKVKWRKKKELEHAGKFNKFKVELKKYKDRWCYSYYYKGNISGSDGLFGKKISSFHHAKFLVTIAIARYIKQYKIEL